MAIRTTWSGFPSEVVGLKGEDQDKCHQKGNDREGMEEREPLRLEPVPPLRPDQGRPRHAPECERDDDE